MKYLSLRTVENAFKNSVVKTSIEFWTLLGVLQSIEGELKSGVVYKFSMAKTASFLGQTFTLSDNYNGVSNDEEWYAKFGCQWDKEIKSFMKQGKVANIYDLAVWALRKEKFENEADINTVIQVFIDRFHFSTRNLMNLFSHDTISCEFEEKLYSDTNLKDFIKSNYSQDNNFDNLRPDGKLIQNAADVVQAGAFIKPFFNKLYNNRCLMITSFNVDSVYSKSHLMEICHFDFPLQQIYYGAPGTGKSNEIKKMTAKGGMFTRDYTIRTTFHPDSDYASFVGAYKPYWDKKEDNGNGKIVYGFRPQSFLKAYIKAWKNPDKNVALVVEEINRGNCAQIFGDIFQLLDREKNGLSKYPIECDVEMQELLAEEFAKESKDFGAAISDDTYADSKEGINNYYSAHYDDAFDKIKSGEILALPMNLSILATMNTSDQSLFPMDSAFKRRWEWIYEPIVEGTNKDTGETLKWKIECGKYKLSADAEEQECVVDWWKFIQKINAVIYSLTSSEDKQLGYFFCQPDKEDGVTISKNLFVGKVIFYLWNEIFKDYAYEHDVCKKENKSDTLYFADFYDGKDNIEQASLMTFFKHLSEFVDKEVKLIEVKVADTPKENADGGETTQKEQNTEQNEATITKNTEA